MYKILRTCLTGLTQVMCHSLFQTSPAACKFTQSDQNERDLG